jgi:putative Mn2+ efflux pump MntP
MSIIEILLIAVALSADAFAVALAIGATKFGSGPGPAFRISFHFGFFQFLMPIIGWLAGVTIEPYVRSFDHWIAFILLAYIGGKMMSEGLHSEGNGDAGDPTRGHALILLSVATSIDALAVGFSLALLEIVIWYPCVIIGIVTGFLSLLGLRLGKLLHARFGKRIEIAGGLVLIGIGLRIVISHLV